MAIRSPAAVAAFAGLLAIPAALGAGYLGLRLERSPRDLDTGPTAAALGDAFAAWGFALAALLLAGIAAAMVSRHPMRTALATVLIGYVGAWMIDARISDAGLGWRETLEGLIFFAPVVAAAAAVAGLTGNAIAQIASAVTTRRERSVR